MKNPNKNLKIKQIKELLNPALDISERDIDNIINNLSQAKLIKSRKKNEYQVTLDQIPTLNMADVVAGNSHLNELLKAIQCLSRDQPRNRKLETAVFPIKSSLIDKVAEMLTTFKEQMINDMSDKGSNSATVVSLSFQLLKLTDNISR